MSEAGHHDRANRWDDAAAGGQGQWATRRKREEVIAVHLAGVQEWQAACSSPTAIATMADGRGWGELDEHSPKSAPGAGGHYGLGVGQTPHGLRRRRLLAE
jgi:hypothetical protein